MNFKSHIFVDVMFSSNLNDWEIHNRCRCVALSLHTLGQNKVNLPFRCLDYWVSLFVFNVNPVTIHFQSIYEFQHSFSNFFCLLKIANRFARGTRQKRKLQRRWLIWRGTSCSCSSTDRCLPGLDAKHRQDWRHLGCIHCAQPASLPHFHLHTEPSLDG